MLKPYIGNVSFLPLIAGEVKWKSKVLASCSRPFVNEALSPKWSFSCPSGRRARNVGECAEWINRKLQCSYLSRRNGILRYWRRAILTDWQQHVTFRIKKWNAHAGIDQTLSFYWNEWQFSGCWLSLQSATARANDFVLIGYSLMMLPVAFSTPLSIHFKDHYFIFLIEISQFVFARFLFQFNSVKHLCP